MWKTATKTSLVLNNTRIFCLSMFVLEYDQDFLFAHECCHYHQSRIPSMFVHECLPLSFDQAKEEVVHWRRVATCFCANYSFPLLKWICKILVFSLSLMFFYLSY